MSERAAKTHRIVVLGPPASGKGTQGRRLAASLGLGYLSTGALLREEVEKRSDLGLLAEPILARGHYLPDELMCRILAEWLDRQSCGWLLDGFPRSLPQAEFLDAWLAERGLALTAAVSLDVPYEILLERIGGRVECPECRWTGQTVQTTDGICPACGHQVTPRSDDSIANFRERHAEFERLTRPVIAYYQARGMIFHCNATKPQDDVAASLLHHFSPCTADTSCRDS